jgi:hypothetical protein
MRSVGRIRKKADVGYAAGSLAYWWAAIAVTTAGITDG